VAHLAKGGEGLQPLVRKAVELLRSAKS
jgi:hypothetical protein